MAQDDAGIFLLRREPLANLFHIDVADARPGKFSADSKTISFLTAGLRVETWDIEQQSRVSAAEVALTQGCLSMDLSPDGKYLACASLAPHPSFDSAKIDFGIYDVSSSAAVYERKNFNSFPFPESVGLWLLTMEGEDTQDLGRAPLAGHEILDGRVNVRVVILLELLGDNGQRRRVGPEM